MGTGILGSDVHILDVVTPADIRALKEKIDPFISALDDDAKKCATLSESTQQEWAKFRAGWESFYMLPDNFFTDFFGAVEKRDLALSYEKQANDWRALLAKQCTTVTLPRLNEQSEIGGSSFGNPILIGLAAGGGLFLLASLLRR